MVLKSLCTENVSAVEIKMCQVFLGQGHLKIFVVIFNFTFKTTLEANRRARYGNRNKLENITKINKKTL